MKFPASLLAAAVLAVTLCLHSELSAQVRDGFETHGWGSPLQEMERAFELRLLQTRGEYRQYETNIRTIEEVAIENCRFEFVEERFCGIAILVSGRASSRKVFGLLERSYGKGMQTGPVGYQWLSPVTHVFYDEDRIGNAYIYLYSVNLQGDPDHLPASPE